MTNFMPYGQLILLPSVIAHLLYRYCFEPNLARLLLDSDKKFFEDGVAGNGSQPVIILWVSTDLCYTTVPVIAIATKFDYLITQVFTEKMGLRKSRKEAMKLLDDKLEVPLRKFKFPPKAYIRIEGMVLQMTISIYAQGMDRTAR